mgnify:CR=1 FL=1
MEEKKAVKQEKELIEQVGIDKTVLTNIKLIDIDLSKFKRMQQAQEFNCKKFAIIEFDDKSPIIIGHQHDGSDWMHIKRLQIKDRRVGQLNIEYRKTTLDNQYHVITSLHVNASDTNNLQNLDAYGYRQRIKAVVKAYDDLYGIKIDADYAKIKRLELNATFKIQGDFREYTRPLNLLISNVPASRYRDSYSNTVKYHTWQEIRDKSVEIETFLVKNTSTELKIYNKIKQLKDCKYILQSAPENVIRIEYTFKDNRVINRQLGDINNISDIKLSAVFWDNLNRDLIKSYNAWCKHNLKDLKNVLKKHLSTNKSDWCSQFYRDCRQFEAINNKPLLFDINDCQQVLKALKISNPARSYNRLVSNAGFEQDLIGQKDKIDEILDKCRKLCASDC